MSYQTSLAIAARNAEDDRDVKNIMKGFADDGYTPERLGRALVKAEQYEKLPNGGSRGNRNVIRAITLIKTLPSVR